MDCNKDEAFKSKEIAETLAEKGDIAKAKKFALIAQKLNPSLEGLDSFLTALDVYISARKRLGGEIDWYAILGVDPTADYDTIRIRYMKLARVLRPDRHKPVGADKAFTLLNQAWNILSDKARRLAYDQKWNFQTVTNSVISNGCHDFSSDIRASASKLACTFWTMCGSCHMQYEYTRNYLNRNLICPQCHKPFTAVKTLPPFIHEKGSWSSCMQQQSLANRNATSQGSLTTEHGIHRSKLRAKNVIPNVLMQRDIRNALMEKARREIRQKNFATHATVFLDKGTKIMEGVEGAGFHKGKTVGNKITDNPGSSGHSKALTMVVPDSDFYDFDQDRTEKSFGKNQVWAAYDDDDGMPRFYAMIHGVVSLKPFKVCISWLNSKNNDELGPVNWIGSGYYKTSGIFWIGKRKISNSLNSFSHRVKWAKGAKGGVQIYPKAGDVWALYRNWSADWDELTPDDVIKKYDMVEVLGDFDEEQGVTISPLVKVPGFKTVFRRHADLNTIMTIPKEKMFCFSHQVASYVMTGKEKLRVPKGYLDLDPAAMPLELLQVLDEKQAREMEETVEKSKEEISRKSKEEKHEKGAAEANLRVYKRRRLKKHETESQSRRF